VVTSAQSVGKAPRGRVVRHFGTVKFLGPTRVRLNSPRPKLELREFIPSYMIRITDWNTTEMMCRKVRVQSPAAVCARVTSRGCRHLHNATQNSMTEE
jgi:hypothetical protein